MATTDRLLLANAIIGQFLSGFGSRIFIVSLPTIAAGLHADIVGISWALIAYQLAAISLSVVFGRLGDVHGRHAIYGIGFAIVSVSSLLCGLAPTVLLLVLFRLLQGVGAAMIASVARVLAMDAMPRGSEGKANGLMTMAFHSGYLLGPPLGGLVIDWVSWRWVFFLLVPIGLTGLGLTVAGARRPAVAPPRGEETAAASRPAIDFVGAGLLVVLTVALALLLDRRSAELVGAGRSWLLALGFVATVVGFAAHTSRAADPVVNVALFRIRMFTLSVLSLLIVATTVSVLSLLLPFYMQDVLHLSPSFMGLVFLAAPAFTIAVAAVSGPLTDRIGPRVPASIGVLLSIASFAVGGVLSVGSSWVLPAVLLGLTGLGTGLFNTPNQTAIIGSVPTQYRGFATGMVSTMFGVGSLLGTSLASALLTVMFRFYSGRPDATPTAAEPAALVSAMNAVFLVCVALLLVALLASLMRGRARVEAAAES